MEFNLKGKVAVITGGSHGIGKTTALALAAEGCDVAICARNIDRLKGAESEILQRNVDCLVFQADVTDKSDLHEFAQNIISKWGTAHILINNVGGGGRWGTADPSQAEENVWVDVYEKNVLSTIRLTFAFLPHMRKQKWGRVISITSRLGREVGGRPWFNIAKFSQGVLMKNLSMYKEYVRDGITFNSVAPGDIMIPDTGWDKERLTNPKFEQYLDEHYPMGRMGSTEDVAAAVVFLCSEPANYLNGVTLPVDGGQSVLL